MDDPTARIGALRGRVARGELHGLGRFETGGGTLEVDRAARILLADLDHDQDPAPERRSNPLNIERRRILLADLLRLRRQIGERLNCARGAGQRLTNAPAR